jgi:hypothetical protein
MVIHLTRPASGTSPLAHPLRYPVPLSLSEGEGFRAPRSQAVPQSNGAHLVTSSYRLITHAHSLT